MRWLLLWSKQSRWRRWALLAGLVAIPAGFGLLLARIGGLLAVLIGAVAVAIGLVWMVATLPPPYRPERIVWPARAQVVAPDPGPAPCALCGYNCIPGGFWEKVPGDWDYVMHTMGCGPDLPGEEPLADPTHRRALGGRYERLPRSGTSPGGGQHSHTHRNKDEPGGEQ